MRITKDEARILAAALEGKKFDLAALLSRSKEETLTALEGLETLEIKLEAIGKDERRRKDDLRDVLKRFVLGRR